MSRGRIGRYLGILVACVVSRRMDHLPQLELVSCLGEIMYLTYYSTALICDLVSVDLVQYIMVYHSQSTASS